MTSALAVYDTVYGNVDIERDAVEALGLALIDARADHRRAAEADGVLVQHATIGAAEMDANPRWKVIGRYGVGVDTIDIDAATARGIRVVNVPDYCEEEVATHAAALVLATVRQVPQADRMVRAQGWNDWRELTPIPALSEATLGVVGLGRIGRETLRLLRPFFGRIVGFDPFVTEVDGVEVTSFADVIAAADVLTLHVPLTADTHHLIDADVIRRMKRGAHLVNVSRGGLVDSAALAAALEQGLLGGAAVDVLETEPALPSDPLLHSPRTIVTNHVAWYSDRSEPRLRGLLATRCAGVLTGAQVPSIVNSTAVNAS